MAKSYTAIDHSGTEVVSMSMALRLALVLPLTLVLAAITGCHSGRESAAPALAPDEPVFLSQAGLRGDLNGNGNPDVSDAIGILRIVVGLDPANAQADCDGDGTTGVGDAIALLRCVVGLDPWPINTGPVVGDTMLGADGQTLVGVPGGSFMMGNEDGYPNEEPIHQVTFSGFWIARCAVTNSQFAEFLNVADPVDVTEWLKIDDLNCGIALVGSVYDPKDLLDDHPAVCVTWNGARAYCDHYGYTLPTEAQWEYAAAGPEARLYPWGDEWVAANCCNRDNVGPFGRTVAVDAIPAGASWCGALNMAGNVWEWCADWYGETYYAESPAVDPRGPDEGFVRILRGGSCLYNWFDCHNTTRNSRRPEIGFDDFGFRVAQAADAS